jgi:hypothetical protein
MAICVWIITLMLFPFFLISSFFKNFFTVLKPFRIPGFLLALFFYFFLMIRVDGVDFYSFQNFINDPEIVTDIGYKYLMYLFNFLALDFTLLLTIQAIITVWAIRSVSKYLHSDLFVAFCIFLIHSAIVRDFSQSRISLAVAFIFFAYASVNKFKKVVLNLVAVSIHLTALFPILIFYLCDKLSLLRKEAITAIILLLSIFFVLTKNEILNVIMTIDPRVNMYMNWKKEFYGLPVANYSSIFFNFFLSIISLLAYKATNNIFYLRFMLYCIFGIISFYILRDLAIFSYRLSHLTLILYPFVLSKIYIDLKKEATFMKNNDKTILLQIAMIFSAFAILAAGFRSDNQVVLASITSYFNF